MDIRGRKSRYKLPSKSLNIFGVIVNSHFACVHKTTTRKNYWNIFFFLTDSSLTRVIDKWCIDCTGLHQTITWLIKLIPFFDFAPIFNRDGHVTMVFVLSITCNKKCEIDYVINTIYPLNDLFFHTKIVFSHAKWRRTHVYANPTLRF